MRLFLKNLAFTLLVPGTVAGFIPYRIISRGPVVESLPRAWLWSAAPVLLVGVSIYLWCLWDFAVVGRGTPAPIDPPTRLVVRGLYRYVRNPMYVGVLLILTGWALLFRSGGVLQYGIAVALLVQLFVMLVEEPLLRRRFGVAYESYRSAVPRRVPRATPWGGS
jgi:protein-S-isoprenylcysteine O-methyltransferase Ste14